MMRHTIYPCLGLLIALGTLPAVAHAEEPAAEEPAAEATQPLDPAPAAQPLEPAPAASVRTDRIVVTGTRTEHAHRESPVPVDVIDRTQIEGSGAHTLAELLTAHASVELVPGVGGTGLRIQGLPSQYVLLLVDGQRVAGQINGIIDLERFHTENIERIEILRGAGSALYGADAMGGVINIITRKPAPGTADGPTLEGDALASYGQRGSLNLSGRLATSHERWSARAYLSHASSDGFHLDPTSLFNTGSAFDEYVGSLGATLAASRALELDTYASYMRRSQERVEAGASRAIFDRRNLFENFQASAGATYRAAGGGFVSSTTLRATAYYELFRNQFYYDQRNSDALDRYEDAREHQVRIEGVGEFALGSAQLLTVGLEGALHRLETERLRDEGGERFRGALYVQDEVFVGDGGQLSVLPGVRVDLDSQYGVHASPQLATRWTVTDALALRASIGMGYRAPSFQELLLEFENPSAGYVIEGNPDLSPETSRSIQLGGFWTPVDVLDLELNLFHNQIDDLIASTTLASSGPGAPLRFGYANIDAARTRGVEASLRLRPLTGWSIETGYALTDTLDLRADRPLEGRARHRVHLALRSTALPLGLDVSTRASLVGPRPFYMDGIVELSETAHAPTHVLWEARVARDFGRHVTAFVRGTNLLDQGDERFLPVAPRTVFMGIQGRL